MQTQSLFRYLFIRVTSVFCNSTKTCGGFSIAVSADSKKVVTLFHQHGFWTYPFSCRLNLDPKFWAIPYYRTHLLLGAPLNPARPVVFVHNHRRRCVMRRQPTRRRQRVRGFDGLGEFNGDSTKMWLNRISWRFNLQTCGFNADLRIPHIFFIGDEHVQIPTIWEHVPKIWSVAQRPRNNTFQELV